MNNNILIILKIQHNNFDKLDSCLKMAEYG
jgi:hypothetical protein